MARYGDLDTLAVKWIQATPTQKQNFKQIIDTHPTADFTPRREWISVDERLPENYEKYLLLLDNGRITIGWYHEGAMQFVEDGIVIINIVTHWMPLPEAPKRKEIINNGKIY